MTDPVILPKTYHKENYIFQKPQVQLLIIILMFITAFGIRLFHITKPPLDFAPIRQYQDAHNARLYYYERTDSIPESLKEIARINVERMGFVVEPQILEYAAVLGYQMSGGEKLWIPRTISVLFWMIGGIFLYLIARQISSAGASLVSTAVYLFHPFAIVASRSFQPDPLMIMMLLGSLYFVLRYHEQQSMGRVLTAAVVSALAMLVKPYVVFLIFGAFLSLSLYKEGIHDTIRNRKIYLFTLVSILPGFCYYIIGMLVDFGAMRWHTSGTFLPHLLLKPYFWKEWVALIGSVVGFIPLMGGLVGLFVIKNGLSRAYLTGLWIGYIAFGFVFTYHIHTHDYYHLQFIPVIALSIGPAIVLAGGWLLRFLSSGKRAVVSVSVLCGFLLVSFFGLNSMNLDAYKRELKFLGYILGVNPQFYHFIRKDFAQEVKSAVEIGEIVDHSTNTVFLTFDFGRSLAYHGHLSGLPWPTSSSLRNRIEMGFRMPKKEELNPKYLTIRYHGKHIKYTPDYFIITDFKEFEMQPDLKDLLYSNFPLLAQNENYLVFDLRKMSEQK